MRPRILALVLCTLAVTATALPLGAASAAETTPLGDAVVAVVDTGINPYHVEFRDDSPRALQHPSTYVPGYPEDAVALPLTLDAESYDDAVRADCDVWATVERGRLYWVPGTRIIGGISFLQTAAPACNVEREVLRPQILDTSGHGTMTASRAVASSYGACPTCLVVAVQFPTSVRLLSPAGSEDAPIEAIAWAAGQRGWVDVQSNSWGPIVPAWDPTEQAGLLTANPRFVSAVEAASAAQPAFWASGNGAAFRAGVLGHPTPLTPHATPSAIMVGGHDSGYVETWPGFPPHLVSDACASPAADHRSIDESDDRRGGGTSAATPFVAGGGIRLLAEARGLLADTSTGQVEADSTGGAVLAQGDPGAIVDGPLADGVLTRAEWQRVLYATATARPAAQAEDGPPCGALSAPYNEVPVRWTDVPAGYPEYLHIGYGAVDAPALSLAARVLRGEAALPDRSTTDTYFTVDDAVGGVTHEVFTATQ